MTQARLTPAETSPGIAETSFADAESSHGRADVVVIGAGPAGALSAILAARAGLDTVLVERKTFPRAKVCGGCLNSAGVDLLKNLGLGAIVEQYGLPVDHLTLALDGRRLELDLPRGVSIPRSLLDHELVKHAIAAGVRFLPETQAMMGDHDTDGVAVRLVSDGNGQLMRAKVAVIATGLGGPTLAGDHSFKTTVKKTARIGAGCTISGCFMNYPVGVISMAVGRHGYVGITPAFDGLAVASACDPAFLKLMDGPAAAAVWILNEAGFPPPAGLEEASWSGTLPLTRRVRPVAGHRVFLVGDAAGYVEPFTGQGMAIALQGAAALAPIVVQAAAEWSPRLARDWSSLYAGKIANRHWPASLVASIVRHKMVARCAFAVAGAIPQISNVLVGAVNRSAGNPTTS